MSMKFFSRRQIAEFTGLSLPTVDGYIHHEDPERRLPATRVGIRVIVAEDDFLEWLKRNRVEGKSESMARRRRKRTATVR